MQEYMTAKLEASKKVTEPNALGNIKIILERLSSDAQELEGLNVSVQEMNKKIKANKSSDPTKAVEYKRLIGQLQDIEASIAQLVAVNTNLIKKIKESSSSGCLDSAELVKAEQDRIRKVSRQARKEAERIGRLQLDVQKIHYFLLKLEDEKNETNKAKSVILSDFLYSRRQRKVHICGCDSVDAFNPHIKKFVKLKTNILSACNKS